jgi:drug/metabolite transporter superfamily protein YnfA
VRFVVLAAALVFIGGMALLTVLYLKSNGPTVVGVLGALVVVVCGVGVIGAFLHPPRK